jgi:hypothetical protein
MTASWHVLLELKQAALSYATVVPVPHTTHSHALLSCDEYFMHIFVRVHRHACESLNHSATMVPAEDRFYNQHPCIILTAKGQPDVATRLFLRKLRMTLKLPVLALVDSDPYGLKILSAPALYVATHALHSA